MISIIKSVTIVLAAVSFSCSEKNPEAVKPRVLVFTKTAGFHHQSIPAGAAAIFKLAGENSFSADSTSDATKFTPDNLSQYAAVVFLNTTGDVLNDTQQDALKKFIESKKGFVGVHAATDTEYDWPWYGNLVGAYFSKHPQQQQATLNVIDRNFIATKHLPEKWSRWDEWYNYKWIASDLHVLITIDETSYTGGENGPNHPMSWYHDYDGGRAFYTELGHTDESYADPLYLKHLLGGIQYAISGKMK
ncbi:ThuA domain-containing protein [Pedobacter sp. HMF7647]|uniref:ThuA domain-containing protein n=1 Tax=Hufsiella arboris TaxID=2695275 RepID=A0A7K1YDJ6_9SPHI|nr:ThuA domain-containing protein [Hufsiella arboris]MXV52652.1 ThuA domain-containing protein [Hufsiella arboris]